MSDLELKPCPFCGGEAELKLYGSGPATRSGVRCVDVMCAGSMRLPLPDEAPVAMWNTRPEDPELTRLRSLLGEAREGLGKIANVGSRYEPVVSSDGRWYHVKDYAHSLLSRLDAQDGEGK